ncbi:hypothetical protein Peur_018322 [Populus x canadensis]
MSTLGQRVRIGREKQTRLKNCFPRHRLGMKLETLPVKTLPTANSKSEDPCEEHQNRISCAKSIDYDENRERMCCRCGEDQFFFVLVIKMLIMNLLLNRTGEMALLKAV